MNIISIYYVASGFFVLLACLYMGVDWWWSSLPASYVVFNILFPKCLSISKHRLVYFIFSLIVYIRYVLIVFVFLLSGNDYLNVIIKEPSAKALSVASVLMIIELVVSLFMVQVFAKKNVSYKYDFLSKKNRNFFLVILVILIALLLFLYSDLRVKYNFISIPELIERAEFQSSIMTFFSILTDYILVLPPLVLIGFYINKYGDAYRFRHILIILIFLTPFLLFFKGVSRFSALLPALAWIITLSRTFPKYKKVVSNIIIAVSSIVFISVSLYKQFSANSISEVSAGSLGFANSFLSLNAYFSGLFNVAYTVDLLNIYHDITGWNFFVNDFFRNIAFFSFISNSDNTSVVIYNNYLYNNLGSKDQIIPLVSQGYLYLGFIGAFIISAVVMLAMIKSEEYIFSVNKVNYLFPIALLSIYLSIHMMVSVNSLYAPVFNFIVPLLIILKINDYFGKVRVNK